jgi:hypothetical protein
MPVWALQGTVVDLPTGTVFRTIDVRVPCSPEPAARRIVLTDDAPFDLSLDGLAAISVLSMEADYPVTVAFDSDAGLAQSLPVESMHLVSRASPITGITLTRQPGQATTVSLILGQEVE